MRVNYAFSEHVQSNCRNHAACLCRVWRKSLIEWVRFNKEDPHYSFEEVKASRWLLTALNRNSSRWIAK